MERDRMGKTHSWSEILRRSAELVAGEEREEDDPVGWKKKHS